MNAQMDIDKRNRHWVALLAFVFITHGGLLAQDKLSAMDAVKVGLERNFNIQILRNQETIAANNNTPGRAGMLPTIGTTGTTSYSVNSTEQKFFTGESRGSNNASTIAFRLRWIPDVCRPGPLSNPGRAEPHAHHSGNAGPGS